MHGRVVAAVWYGWDFLFSIHFASLWLFCAIFFLYPLEEWLILSRHILDMLCGGLLQAEASMLAAISDARSEGRSDGIHGTCTIRWCL